MSKKNPNRRSTFTGFLKDEGTCDHATAVAVKRVLAFQMEQAMEKEHLSKNQMDRIFDPENPNIQLDTIMKAASVLGRELHLELV